MGCVGVLAIIYDWQKDYDYDDEWVWEAFFDWEASHRIFKNWSEALERVMKDVGLADSWAGAARDVELAGSLAGEAGAVKAAEFRLDKCLGEMMFELYREITDEIAEEMDEEDGANMRLLMEFYEEVARGMAE